MDRRRAAAPPACRTSKLIETPGNPVVYGDWLNAPGKPTILFYGHYDVQPVDPLNLWTSPPFEATVRDGEIYARGSADDKGQVFMHIKAIEAHLKKNGSLPVNIKFFIEGEEEVGSVHLDEFVRAHKQELAADVVVISDSPMFDRGIPSICYGLRGLAYFQIDLRGTKSDLHSGSFGGAVANPAFVLAQILAQMKDRSGRIKIPGFYDDVRPLSDAERAEWKKLPFNETKYRKELGAPRLFGETGLLHARARVGAAHVRGERPAVGFTGEGAKTVLPATAMAKVSMRLVPDQHPDKIARPLRGLPEEGGAEDRGAEADAHARRQAVDDRVRQQVRARRRARPSSCGFGQAPVFNREGGSIPVVSTFQEELGLPSVLFGVGPARRERARARREARPRQLPQRHHRVGVPLRRDRATYRAVGRSQLAAAPRWTATVVPVVVAAVVPRRCRARRSPPRLRCRDGLAVARRCNTDDRRGSRPAGR